MPGTGPVATGIKQVKEILSVSRTGNEIPQSRIVAFPCSAPGACAVRKNHLPVRDAQDRRLMLKSRPESATLDELRVRSGTVKLPLL